MTRRTTNRFRGFYASRADGLKLNIIYYPKLVVSLSNIALIIIALILMFGRTRENLKISTVLDLLPDFYQHISNFSLSYLLVAGSGFLWLLLGINFNSIIRLGIAVLLGNFVYELWIPILNTPDIIDAYYGFWGTFLGCVFLLITKKYGLRANTICRQIMKQKQRDSQQ